MDRETLSLPNSQFYTGILATTHMLSPIAQTPVEKEKTDAFSLPTAPIVASPTTPIFELTEEVNQQ